jgi:putative phage-type endonuclease
VTALDEQPLMETRGQGIGASEIAAVLGLSPWSSPWEIWARKVNPFGMARDDGDRGRVERMRWGLLLEPAISEEWETRTGLRLLHRQVRFAHPDTDGVCFATVDGLAADHDDAEPADCLGVVELKTTGDRRWDQVPDHYQIQVQYQMACVRLPTAWVACLHAGQRLSLWEIEADPAVQAALIDAARAFWARHVIPQIPPPVDGTAATAQALRDTYQAARPRATVDLDDAVALAVSNLREIKKQQADLEDKRALAEQQIQAALGEAEDGTYNGATVVTWRAQQARNIDRAKLRDEWPSVYADVETTTTIRVLRTPKDDE